MSRGKTEINKIDNQTRRQVTFSKRRKGLLKKGKELSILSDSEVGIFIFSHTGRLYEYATHSIESILERYYQAHGHVRVLQPESEAQGYITSSKIAGLHQRSTIELWRVEVEHLRQQLEETRKSNRQLLGEDLSELRMEELENLENQLDISSNVIRNRKVEKIHCMMQEYHKKELLLHEENMKLHKTASQLQQEIAKLQKVVCEASRISDENANQGAASTSLAYTPYDPVLLKLS